MEHTVKDDIDNNQQDTDQFKHVNVSKRILQYQMRIRKLSELSGFTTQTGRLSEKRRTKSLSSFDNLEENIEKKETSQSDEPTSSQLIKTLPDQAVDENNNSEEACSKEIALPSVKLLSQRFTFEKVTTL